MTEAAALEVFFYHLQRAPLEAVLPRLLLLSLERGWRATVRFGSDERLKAMDDHLWMSPEDGFLPHGTDDEEDPAGQPILLTRSDANRNGAAVAFLADGAPFPAEPSGFARVAVMLDGTDPEAVAAGRALWRTVREAVHVVAYWQQDEDGRWQKRA